MQILPSGFALPALPYLLGLLITGAATVAFLYQRRPPITEDTVTALAPWMAGGGALYALYQNGVVPPGAAPLFSSPAVYLTTGILLGIVWAITADCSPDGWDPTSTPGLLAITGSAVLLSALTAGYASTVNSGGDVNGGIAVGILVGAVVLTVGVWFVLFRVRGRAVEATGSVGLLVVFAHALDGVSTAVGYDLLGFGEQTPLSRIIIEAAGALPTAELIGAGWLFVLVKLVLAAGVVAVFEDYVREEPAEGYLFLGLIAAVGLGPGAHNVVLFALA